ncbi:MAG: T9SS type A sorting domain-containing protein [Saprospiraceae bacterium]|nr:T9SS type A sorting domain-containing protein [Saprospiraceae bacterium]
MYPNPVNSLLQIEGLDPKVVSIITIHHLLGHLVLKQSQATSQYNIDIQTLPQGIYLLTVVSGANSWQQKIIIQ